MKPTKPITRREIYLDVITGGDATLPTPLTREETYLAKIAGENIEIPSPVTRYEQYLAAISGEAITVPEPLTRLEKLLYKATGEDIEVDSPITREESYWYDYEGGGGETEKEYTGAVPTTITANGEPLLAWTISGNMSQSGTPTPENPITPSECGERTGNLFSCDIEQGGLASADGQPTVSDTRIRTDNYISLTQGSYTVSIKETNKKVVFYVYNTSKQYIQGESVTSWQSLPFQFTLSADRLVKFAFANDNNTNISPSDISEVTLNTGSTALPYEPYGFKIPISSGNTTTPVYLGEVESTRQIKKLVFDGTENWSGYGSPVSGIGVVLALSDMLSNGRTNGRCTHFTPQLSPSGSSIDGVTFGASNATLYLTFSVASATVFNLTDTASVKAWLAAQYAAGTPVTVWYVLATEETGIVNEPLRKIGGYADTISNVAEIPTTAGEQTFDVDTSLKPSEVYIKYKGK